MSIVPGEDGKPPIPPGMTLMPDGSMMSGDDILVAALKDRLRAAAAKGGHEPALQDLLDYFFRKAV